MRVRLKGLNSKTKTLADGTRRTYYWAWKGGLPGKPGDPEFIAAFNEAVARKRQPQRGTLLEVLNAFQSSSDWHDLAPRTQKDYIRQIKIIERKFADFPLAAMSDRRTRGIFKAWRDELALRSRRQADYAWQVLARTLSWAHERGLVSDNPCARGGRLYRGNRADKVWSIDDEHTFMANAPDRLQLAFMLALWTGQRQGDLLRLTWAAYDGKSIRLRQSKTGARVIVPVGTPLKAMLDNQKRRSPVILLNSEGQPWTADGFRTSWRKACRAAGIEGVTFNDLRGTAVTRLALVECTEAEIASITGHTLRDVRSILDSNYLHRDPALAESAIRKLETGTKFPTERPTGTNGSKTKKGKAL